jgi:hypothetical protein
MNNPNVLLLGIAVAIAMSTGALAGGGYQRDLGGVNLNYYCSKTFGSGFKSVLVGKTAGDWTCQQSQNDRRPISVQAACNLQYGRSGLKAKALNWNDPLSWRCFAPQKPK